MYGYSEKNSIGIHKSKQTTENYKTNILIADSGIYCCCSTGFVSGRKNTEITPAAAARMKNR